MNLHSNRLFGYARGSTNEQEVTLQAQSNAIKLDWDYRWKEHYAWGDVFIDQGVSGSVPFLNRKAGLALSLELRRGDAVVFTKLDRGFRNVRDFLTVKDLWHQKGVRIILLDMQLDTSTPAGEMLSSMLAVIGQFERARCQERCREVQAQRKRTGLPVGRPPYGFRMVGERGKRRLVHDPTLREVGRVCLEWNRNGWSLSRIWAHLLEQRVRRGPKALEYSRAGIARMVKAEAILQAVEAAGLEPRPEHLSGLKGVPS